MGLSTGAELLDEALRLAGEKTDGTSEFEAIALDRLNQNYKALLSGSTMFDTDLGQPFHWAKSRYPGILTLEPPHETGTVSLTQDSTAGSFSNAPTASMAGRFLKLTDRPEFFRIAAHTAGATPFTLDAAYPDETISLSGYKAHKLDYTLDAAAIINLFSPMRVYRSQSSEGDGKGLISGLDLRMFDEKWPLKSLKSGTPTEFTWTYASSGSIEVRFNKSVDVKTRVEYDYVPEPTEISDSSSSIPVVPISHRIVLAYMAAHDILIDKEDDKSQIYFGFAQAQLRALVAANRKEKQLTRRNYARIIPRLDLTRRRSWDIEE